METEVKENSHAAFDRWCEIYGNQKRLADYCKVSPQAVGQWRKRVPAERVLQIESGTNFEVSRHDLRPDLYPVEETSLEESAA